MDAFQTSPVNRKSSPPDVGVANRRKLRKSRTETWSDNILGTSENNRCRFCSVHLTVRPEEASDKTESSPSPKSDSNVRPVVNAKQQQPDNSVPRQLVRTCFKHPNFTPTPTLTPAPTPTPPPIPASPEVRYLSFSPTCSQHCRKVFQKKSGTSWRPRSSASTVSTCYTKEG